MSFELAQQCIDLDVLEHDLSPKEKFVLVVLCRFADNAGCCYPSLPTLLGLTGFDVRTARKAIENLVKKGWLAYVQEPGKKRQYTINATKIQRNCDPVQICTPGKNAPGTNLHPVQICTLTPDKNAGGTPYKNAPRIKHTRNQEETNLQIVDDSSFSLEPDQPQAANEVPAENTTSNTADTAVCTGKRPAETKKPAKCKAITHLFELEAIPDEWRELCEQIRPDLDPQRVFVEFRFYWTQGKGQGTRRSDKGWTSTWMNWIKRQKEQRVQNSRHGGSDWMPDIPFEKRNYGEGINDDHSF